MVRFALLSLLATLLMSPTAQAGCAKPPNRVMIWQPLIAHGKTSEDGWDRMLQALKRSQSKQVMLQWLQYGEHSFWRSDDWLRDRIAWLDDNGVGVIAGLYLSRHYFEVLNADDATLQLHLNQSGNNNIALARHLVKRRGGPLLRGWYLPQEIDDLNWQTPHRRALLLAYLKSMRTQLKALAPNVPVYVSTFFSGAMPPKQYAAFLAELSNETGIIWLVQDGFGTRRHPAPSADSYLAAVSQTIPAKQWIGLLENFSESGPENAPIFRSASITAMAAREARWCSATGLSPRFVFALNHLRDNGLNTR
ncbi:DUF4434 domain-containing protein [Chitinibacteraceae bacterium HSL-7]